VDDLPALRGAVGAIKQFRRLHEGRDGAGFQPVEAAPPDPLSGQLRGREQTRDSGADQGFADPDLGAKPDQRAGPQDAAARHHDIPVDGHNEGGRVQPHLLRDRLDPVGGLVHAVPPFADPD